MKTQISPARSPLTGALLVTPGPVGCPAHGWCMAVQAARDRHQVAITMS